MPPSEVEALIGVAASTLCVAGVALKPGTRPLRRSIAKWSVEFENTARLNDMLPLLINRIRGADHVATVRQAVMPEFLEIDIAMWIKDSEEQEGGLIDLSTLEMLTKMGATLSFGFYVRNPT
jgi:hypothetical protein